MHLISVLFSKLANQFENNNRLEFFVKWHDFSIATCVLTRKLLPADLLPSPECLWTLLDRLSVRASDKL